VRSAGLGRSKCVIVLHSWDSGVWGDRHQSLLLWQREKGTRWKGGDRDESLLTIVRRGCVGVYKNKNKVLQRHVFIDVDFMYSVSPFDLEVSFVLRAIQPCTHCRMRALVKEDHDTSRSHARQADPRASWVSQSRPASTKLLTSCRKQSQPQCHGKINNGSKSQPNLRRVEIFAPDLDEQTTSTFITTTSVSDILPRILPQAKLLPLRRVQAFVTDRITLLSTSPSDVSSRLLHAQAPRFACQLDAATVRSTLTSLGLLLAAHQLDAATHIILPDPSEHYRHVETMDYGAFHCLLAIVDLW
jgi:hypothetical protein